MPERPPTPSDWAGAFAALPAETPPAGGWARLAERLAEQPVAAVAAASAPVAATARRSRQRWALAAMLAAALPLGLWLGLRAQRPAQGPVSEPLVRQAPPAAAPRRDAAAPTQADDANRRIAASGHADEGNRSIAATADRGRDGLSEPRPSPPPATADATRPPRTAAAERRLATAENIVPQPRAAAAAPSDPTGSATPERAADDARLAAQLRELQAESAQLEALVAASRDERVASAAVAVMSADLDQRLRLIDTALIDGALPAVSRVALWRERVDSLRALAGVESTQRWFAARGGERYDGALVRVD